MIDGVGADLNTYVPNLLYVLLYAEMHYTVGPLFSFLKRRWPEVIADAPCRIQPSVPIPILCLIKDAHLYPVVLEAISVSMSYASGRSAHVSFPLNVPVDGEVWHHVFWVEPVEGGEVRMDVRFDLKRGRRHVVVYNDNYRTLSHGPLQVHVASTSLPCSSGWHYGEAHGHTSYTRDQVEFGAPPRATALLARAMGLSWMAVTDHSYDLDDRVDSFLKNHPSFPRWRQCAAEVEALGRTMEDFAVVLGEEISCGNRDQKNVHLLAYGLKTFIEGKGDGAERGFRTKPDLRIGEAVERVVEQGGVAYAAHPLESFSFLQRLLLGRGSWGAGDFSDEGLVGLQIWNGRQDQNLWCAKAAWIRMLLEGRHVFIIGGNDAHGDFNRRRRVAVPFVTMREEQDKVFGQVRTGLLLKGGLHASAVVEALRSGCAMVTDGPFLAFHLKNEQGDVAHMGGTLFGARIQLYVEAKTTDEFGPFDEIVVFQGDLYRRAETVLRRFSRNVVSDHHDLLGQEIEIDVKVPGYVRAEGNTERGHRCLTNPIWISPL